MDRLAVLFAIAPAAIAAPLMGLAAQEPTSRDSTALMQAAAPPPVAEAVSQMEGYVIAMPARQRLPNSLVLLETGERARTDLNGHFAFARLTPGRRDVMIVAPGCKIAFTHVDLEPWQTRRIGFTIEWSLEDQADEARRRSAEGVLITSQEIDAMEPRDLPDVIRRVAPDMVGRGRQVTAASGGPMIVLNGMPAIGSAALRDIRPRDVAYIEILKGASGGWSYGSEGASGVIKITTKLGMDTDAPPMDPGLCDLPEWP